MKYLDLDELQELSAALNIPEEIVAKHIQVIEQSMGALAELCAEKMGVRHAETSHQPAFGGLCSAFGAIHAGQECPPALREFDTDGEFEAESGEEGQHP